MMQTAPTLTASLASSSSPPPPPPLATPNQIYDASTYSKKIISTKNGVLYEVNAPDTASLKVMHLYGDAYERGVAHGSLLSDELVQFMTTDLQSYFLQECDQIPVDKLPKWLAGAIVKLCQDAAPTAFDLALGWVWDQQVKYINASKTNVVEEMQGIAAGICKPARINATVPSLCSNPKKLLKTIYNVNMLPELVQMQCSMMGAWGAATPDQKLVQLRTLDFGGGPFADQTMLVVHHPTDTSIPFAALSFPAFTGVVTGFSSKLAQSEKVDDVSGSGGRPEGSYDGQAVAMVIRDMVQLSSTKEEAIAIANQAQRTWSVWLGFGDDVSQKFVAMLYDQVREEAVFFLCLFFYIFLFLRRFSVTMRLFCCSHQMFFIPFLGLFFFLLLVVVCWFFSSFALPLSLSLSLFLSLSSVGECHCV